MAVTWQRLLINSSVIGTTNRVTATNNADGTVTLSAPQDLHTAATPTFGGVIAAYLRPAADGATAVTLQDKDGNALVTLNTTSDVLSVPALSVNGAPFTGTFNVLGAQQDAVQTLARLGAKNASAQLKAFDIKLTAGTPEVTFATAAVGADPDFSFLIGAVTTLKLLTTGVVGVNTTSPTISDGAGVDINGKILRLRSSKTPASAAAAGNVGEICWDASYIYVCTATNTWKRAAIATW